MVGKITPCEPHAPFFFSKEKKILSGRATSNSSVQICQEKKNVYHSNISPVKKKGDISLELELEEEGGTQGGIEKKKEGGGWEKITRRQSLQ